MKIEHVLMSQQETFSHKIILHIHVHILSLKIMGIKSGWVTAGTK